MAGAQSLAGAAQLNVIEFHTWNSTKNAIDTPDRMTFADLAKTVPSRSVDKSGPSDRFGKLFLVVSAC